MSETKIFPYVDLCRKTIPKPHTHLREDVTVEAPFTLHSLLHCWGGVVWGVLPRIRPCSGLLRYIRVKRVRCQHRAKYFFLTWVGSQVHPESEEAIQGLWLHSTTQKSMTSLTHCFSNIENNLIYAVPPHTFIKLLLVTAESEQKKLMDKPNGNFPPVN